jgi:hypothetical protein
MATIDYPDVVIDANGNMVEQHVAAHHVPGGEVTLCGVFVTYDGTVKGTAPGAPECPTCKARDC